MGEGTGVAQRLTLATTGGTGSSQRRSSSMSVSETEGKGEKAEGGGRVKDSGRRRGRRVTMGVSSGSVMDDSEKVRLLILEEVTKKKKIKKKRKE